MDGEEWARVMFTDRYRKNRAIARALIYLGKGNMREAVGYVIAQGWFATVEEARLFVKERRKEIKLALEDYERHPEQVFKDAQEDAGPG